MLYTLLTILKKLLFPKINQPPFSHLIHFKTHLQQLIQPHPLRQLQYKLFQQKPPPHNPEFLSPLSLNPEHLRVGLPRSKKEAQ
ncbi:putative dsRNA-binding protein, partial [Priestia megaterium]|uniref:putative dsRNA-binding protein n=1 Tax=Priestia megaterium TaxID=1404 RepID=UPI0037097523